MLTTQRADWPFIITASLFWSIGLLVTFWDFIALRDARYVFGPLGLLGLALCSAGVAIRLTARRTLGSYFAHGLRLAEGHILLRHGIYSRVRHPAYTGALLFHFGTPLIFNSPMGCLAMLPLVPCFLYRIRIEERMLLRAFGEEYLEYRQHTRKLVPFVY